MGIVGPMEKFLISPPFGNWFGAAECTRVMGSYTLHRRRGLLWRIAKTLRPVPGGWVNNIGLRNPGILSIRQFLRDRMYSVVGLEDGDWEVMLTMFPPGQMVEINLGCKNVHEYGISPGALRMWCLQHRVSVKLPMDDRAGTIASMAESCGARWLHASNTIPTPRGGESGDRLRGMNLDRVQLLKENHPHMSIIAGGGIYKPEHVEEYGRRGADHFSLSTICFNPFRLRRVLATVYDE